RRRSSLQSAAHDGTSTVGRSTPKVIGMPEGTSNMCTSSLMPISRARRAASAAYCDVFAARRVRHRATHATSICSIAIAIPAAQTTWRAAAERLRRRTVISHAAPRTRVLFSAALTRIGHADTVQLLIGFTLFLGLLDHLRHAIQFLVREARGGHVQQRRHNLFGRPVEESLHHVLHGG